MNRYGSYNYKHGSAGSNCGNNILNYPILLPKNLLLKFHNFEYRAEMKFEVSQKQTN